MLDKLSEPNLVANDSKKEILELLGRILSSDLFSRSAVLSNFLKFIVEETLEGNTDRLKEYTIAVSALGRSSDFNPQTDAVVRIHAGRLRRFLKEYYEGLGISDTIKIEVVKGTYVPMFRTQVVNQAKIETSVEPITATLSDNHSVGYSRSRLTLAILPFRNLCPDDEYKFFVDGFGEELTRIFSASEEIAVVAHYSTLKYATPIEDIRTIGADLGVHYVINGSVKRSAKKIRVSVGLVETVNGMQIWSKDYIHDLKKDQIMEIQEQIDNDVYTILCGHYGFIITDTMRLVEDNLKHDLETFDAILWYHHAGITNSEKDYQRCRKGLENILEKDPNNVMSLAILADIYLFSYSLGYVTVEDPINEAYKLIKKALRIAPFSQFSNLILAWAYIYLGKKEEAIEKIEYSEQLAPPSASSKGLIGFGYACVGHYKRSQSFLQEALDLNPYCPWWYYMGFYFVYYQAEKYDLALRYTQKMNASDDIYLIPLLTVAVQGQLSMIKEAQTNVSLLQKNFPEILSNLKIYLGSFILDDSLVDEIIHGARKSGLTIG